MSDTGHVCTFCEIDDYYLICGSADNWGNSKYAVLLKIDKDGYIVRARWKGGGIYALFEYYLSSSIVINHANH